MYNNIYNNNTYNSSIPISALISVASTSILVLILLTSHVNSVEYIALANASRASLACIGVNCIVYDSIRALSIRVVKVEVSSVAVTPSSSAALVRLKVKWLVVFVSIGERWNVGELVLNNGGLGVVLGQYIGLSLPYLVTG